MYYKFLTKDGRGEYSGVPWNLPTEGDPGEWMPEIQGNLVQCEVGYHAATQDNLAEWVNARLFELEFDGEPMQGEGKAYGRKARLVREIPAWGERTARLFSCDCAERALPIWEAKYPNDRRPHECIAVARRFANGEATNEELAAARDAAWAAAGAAAWAAAGAAAGDAARDAARAAARDAAWAAAGAAAWAAAGAAAGAAERSWQNSRLLQYANGEVE